MNWIDRLIKTNLELALGIVVALFAGAIFIGFVVPQVYGTMGY